MILYSRKAELLPCDVQPRSPRISTNQKGSIQRAERLLSVITTRAVQQRLSNILRLYWRKSNCSNASRIMWQAVRFRDLQKVSSDHTMKLKLNIHMFSYKFNGLRKHLLWNNPENSRQIIYQKITLLACCLKLYVLKLFSSQSLNIPGPLLLILLSQHA